MVKIFAVPLTLKAFFFKIELNSISRFKVEVNRESNWSAKPWIAKLRQNTKYIKIQKSKIYIKIHQKCFILCDNLVQQRLERFTRTQCPRTFDRKAFTKMNECEISSSPPPGLFISFYLSFSSFSEPLKTSSMAKLSCHFIWCYQWWPVRLSHDMQRQARPVQLKYAISYKSVFDAMTDLPLVESKPLRVSDTLARLYICTFHWINAGERLHE